VALDWPTIERLLDLKPALSQLASEKREAGDWEGYLCLFDRRGRPECFRWVACEVSDAEYWHLLAVVWTDTEGPTQHRRLWLDLFRCDRPGRHNLMTESERTFLEALPDPVTIYRGAPEKGKRGISWTVDPERAAWFAVRFNIEEGHVYSASVPKSRIFAYFEERDEREVVIDPIGFRDIKRMDWDQQTITQMAQQVKRN